MPSSKTPSAEQKQFNWLRYFQYFVYYASFLVWPLLIYALVMCWLDFQIWWGSLLLLSLLFIYVRFVEPEWIRLRREKLLLGDSGKSVLIVFASDLHLGVFKGERFLKKILAKISAVGKIDLILLGGDLINDPKHSQLPGLFKPWKGFHPKVLAITGNHDAGVPGDFSSQEVRQAIEPHGLVAIDNMVVQESFWGREFKIVGLSDLMEGGTEWGLVNDLDDRTINIVMAHNPDAVYQIPKDAQVDLVIAGHTHGGQIRLPPLSNWLIPCEHPFVRGWYRVNGKRVYVSSGLGEVVLPIRFLLPPELVILEIMI